MSQTEEVRAVRAPTVHVAADFGPYGSRRDRAVEAALSEQGVALHRTGYRILLALAEAYGVVDDRHIWPDGKGPRSIGAALAMGACIAVLAAAGLLVFVDVLKELPATFALRPFNFDTLAIEAYNLAKDERLAEAAVPSLVIVAVGLAPVTVLEFVVVERVARNLPSGCRHGRLRKAFGNRPSLAEAP